jgi:importin subunit alpha-1
MLPLLALLLHKYKNNNAILIELCCIYKNLTQFSNDQIQKVIDSGVCEKFKDLLSEEKYKVNELILRLLRVIGNIASGNDSQTQILIDLNILTMLVDIMNFFYTSDKAIIKEICFIVSNIVAGNTIQIKVSLRNINACAEVSKLWLHGNS